jgi:hypothetical protein
MKSASLSIPELAVGTPGSDVATSTGAQLRLPFYYSLLAEAYEAAGQTREALASVAIGLGFVDTNRERWAEPELRRVHGQILEQAGHRWESAESYRKAVEAALRIGALPFARRAEARLRPLRDADASQPGG